jgi:negative regulator of genetic competence, sporulation and motility
MEMILISKSRLKVMLTREDMEDYDICPDMTDTSDPISRKIFWGILNEAKEKTGFDSEGHRIFVQMYPSRHGGCEMFVTRMSEAASEDNKARSDIGVIYVFDSMDSMLMSCRYLLNVDYTGESTAYADRYSKKVFLSLDREVEPLCEFGGKRCRISVMYYIAEHCITLCEGAVYRLGVLM